MPSKTRTTFFPHPILSLVAVSLLVGYLAYVALTEAEFDLQPIFALTTLFFYGKLVNQQHPKPVAKPLDHLQVADGVLRLHQQRFDLATVNKVVIDVVDGKGLLQLPFNQRGAKVPELWFDAARADEVRQFVRRHLPQAEIIT
ncbi:hypothetical protein [Gallaecimonas sp. GXIMD4217]|uniref:hypothetical protein n=1 Tax=Gallaecimonas sp. GXIMD4217 TaxID=3131927 RepID=UPI00311AEF37